MTDALTLFTHAEELEYFHWCVSGVLQLIHFRLFECRVSFTSCRNVYLEWERWVACFSALLRVALSDTDICIFVNYYNMGSSKTRAVSRSSVYVCAAVCFPEYYFVWIWPLWGRRRRRGAQLIAICNRTTRCHLILQTGPLRLPGCGLVFNTEMFAGTQHVLKHSYHSFTWVPLFPRPHHTLDFWMKLSYVFRWC